MHKSAYFHLCIFICVCCPWTCMCTCKWKPKVDVRCPPWSFHVFIYLSIIVCMMCGHACAVAPMWRPEGSLWSRFSSSTFSWSLGIEVRFHDCEAHPLPTEPSSQPTLSLEAGSFTKAGGHQFGWIDSWAGPRDPLVFVSPSLELQVHPMPGFYIGSGTWTQVFFICGQDFTGGILSLALNNCLFKKKMRRYWT